MPDCSRQKIYGYITQHHDQSEVVKSTLPDRRQSQISSFKYCPYCAVIRARRFFQMSFSGRRQPVMDVKACYACNFNGRSNIQHALQCSNITIKTLKAALCIICVTLQKKKYINVSCVVISVRIQVSNFRQYEI